MNIKVSVIVPVYNVGPYLTTCLESLINQTLKDIEIIAVNDNSTDNSLEILNIFAKKDKRIKIINNITNLGTAATRNIGLSEAMGEYVAFIDGDDYLDLDFLYKLYFLAIDNNADVSKGLTKTINVDGRIDISAENSDIEKDGKFAFMGYLLSGIYKRDLLNCYKIRFYIDFSVSKFKLFILRIRLFVVMILFIIMFVISGVVIAIFFR